MCSKKKSDEESVKKTLAKAVKKAKRVAKKKTAFSPDPFPRVYYQRSPIRAAPERGAGKKKLPVTKPDKETDEETNENHDTKKR